MEVDSLKIPYARRKKTNKLTRSKSLPCRGAFAERDSDLEEDSDINADGRSSVASNQSEPAPEPPRLSLLELAEQASVGAALTPGSDSELKHQVAALLLGM